MKTPLVIVSALFFAIPLYAQVPDSPGPAPAPQAAPAGGGAAGGAKPSGSFLGKDVPSFDPGSNILSWDGKNWNVANNELFQARFEKYLDAPEETTADDKNYQAIVKQILDDLAPSNVTPKTIDEAFRLLPKASSYDIDAHLCDSLADAVYSAWKAENAGDRLDQANLALEEERKRHEWNNQVLAQGLQMEQAPSGKNGAAQAEYRKDMDAKRDAELLPETQRLVEVQAMIKKNQLTKELNSVQMKIQFQALIVQYFMQRRFQHVLMATRFYRAVFSDGDTSIAVGKDTHDLFANSTGMPPTVGTIDSMANEAIRDVREGVQAYEYLLQNDQLEGATKRLAEAFTVGEYMPELRTLPRVEKQKALVFTQQTNQLISAIDVKDYTLAETLVHTLEKTAKDFDNSKPMAAIETARTVANLHIVKAKNAMVSGDKATLETELTQAVEIWPRNPALKEFTDVLENNGSAQQRALADLDQLISQHNYRQIFDDKIRFIAAVAMDPKRAEQLQKVLADMQKIETALMEADARSKQGDYAGAWENVETVYKDFPDDSKLNGVRATLTTEVPDFVHTLRTAEDLEQKDQVGSSLAWYLKAQKIYPSSEFAHEGIDRLVKKILPEG
jgi:hypothetical protein